MSDALRPLGVTQIVSAPGVIGDYVSLQCSIKFNNILNKKLFLQVPSSKSVRE